MTYNISSLMILDATEMVFDTVPVAIPALLFLKFSAHVAMYTTRRQSVLLEPRVLL